MPDIKVRVGQPDIKVRVGQSDAVKIISTGLKRGDTAISVNGGTANVTQLDVSGQSNLNTLNVTGITTFNSTDAGSAEIIIDSSNKSLTIGTGVTITDSNISVSDLASFRLLNVSGVSTFVSNVNLSSNLDVDGTTDLDTLNVAETATFSSNIDANGNLDVDGTTELDTLNVAETATFSSNIDANGNLDVDGHTELDNLNVSGISTFGDDVIFTGANSDARWDYSTSDLTLFDNTRLIFGNSDDFQIWHGGSHTFIKNSGGDLRIRGNKILLKSENDSEKYLEATVNNDVKLFFNNNEKFATISTGATVTGDLFVDGTLTAGLIDGGLF